MMWVGAQINTCFVTARVFIGASRLYTLTRRSFYHPFTSVTLMHFLQHLNNSRNNVHFQS